ncbi:hypothetical protein AL066_02765 [Pseudomonas nunensis]|nr:hypothetical protein AL066_02765 [Pseudomonas nunensis]
MQQLYAGIKQNFVRVPKPLMGAEKMNRFCMGFGLAAYPCKGILQARLRPHYREKNRAVVRRNGTENGRRGRFFDRSEGLQGFGWVSQSQFFFHNFWRAGFLFKK